MKPATASVRLAAAAGALAVAVWLLPASVHITSWPSSGPVRLAFLAPMSRLYVAAAIAAIAIVLLDRVWRRGGRRRGDLANAVAPLLLLWLWLLPFLPWLPDRAPLLLVLAGPARWGIAGLAFAGLVAAWRRERPARTGSWPGPGRVAVFALSLIVYAGLGLQFRREVGYGGDEPHYLIITQSLVADRDLDIANNHERREYRGFFPGELRPDFLRRGLHGEIYSIHAPGLPALIAPAYLLGGATATMLFLAVLAALTALAIFDLAALVAGPAAATATLAAACFTVPFVPHAWLIYPELPGALIVAWAALWLRRPPASPAVTSVHGVALAALPWLHTKFILFTALFGLFECGRLWPRRKQIAALVTPIGLSGLAWLYSFYRMYGEFSPEAPYGTYTQMFVLARNIPRGVLGLLFDQKFGLLVYSPVYILAIAGAWLTLRDRRERIYTIELLVAAAAFFVSTTRLYMWWGGSSAPARFLVPIVPLLAPMIAVAIQRADNVVGRSVVASTIVLGLIVTVVTVGSPGERLLYSDPHGVASIVKVLQGSAPLDVALPTFTEENWRAPIAALVPWLATAGVVALVLLAAVRRGLVRSTFWAAATGTVTTLIVGSVLVGLRPLADRQAVTTRGALAAMTAYDPGRLRAVDVSHVRRLGEGEVLANAALIVKRAPDAEVPNPRVLEGPFELPEGRYEARLWFTGAPAADAFVGLSDQILLARASPSSSNPVVLPFELSIRTPAFVGVGDLASARAIRQVDIVPTHLVPRSARDPQASHVVEPVGGEAPGYMAYSDANTYPENGVFWTRDTQAGSIVIVTAGASRLRLVLHVGRSGGPVVLDVGGQKVDVDLKPDETRELTFPLPPDTKRIGVSVRAARSFRPADVDPHSDDQRLLGCQVRPLLS